MQCSAGPGYRNTVSDVIRSKYEGRRKQGFQEDCAKGVTLMEVKVSFFPAWRSDPGDLPCRARTLRDWHQWVPVADAKVALGSEAEAHL